MAVPGLTAGRNVHYVMIPMEAFSSGNEELDAHRAALVNQVFDRERGVVGLSVFLTTRDCASGRNGLIERWQYAHLNGYMDDPKDTGVYMVTATYSPDKEPGTWHFIEPTP